MTISRDFQDCTALLVMSRTHVRTIIASIVDGSGSNSSSLVVVLSSIEVVP